MENTEVTGTSHGFTVKEWKPYSKNTLLGFLSLELPSGLVLHDLTLHRRGDDRWLSMPAKSFDKDGAKGWAPLIEFSTKESRDKFQAAALSAMDAYFEEVDARCRRAPPSQS
jgi:hypothetical protein